MKYILFTFLTFVYMVNAQLKRAITVEDLWLMQRIGTVEISNDGNWLAFNLTTYNMEKNKGNSDIYLISPDGSNLRAIRKTDKNESSVKFSPDGKKIAYIFEDQVWICNYDGTNETQLTNLSTGVSGIVWCNDGKRILFTSQVYPDCYSDEQNKQKDEDKEKSKVKARIFTELMYRHWNEWREEKRSHLFLLDIETQEYYDLTQGNPNDVPPIALGSSKDFSFSPDGNEVAFTMNTDKVLATSTNNDIFLIDLRTTSKEAKSNFKQISTSKGNDFQPIYSPDGKYIIYCSMERAGFEADKHRLMLYDRSSGTTKHLTDKIDRSPLEIVWSPDSKYIFFNAINEINESIYKMEISTGECSIVLKEHHNSNILISPDGRKLYFKQQRANLPHEIFSCDVDGKNLTQISFINKDNLARLEMNNIETFWCKGAKGTPVQSILVKPPFFDEKKKYPMIFLIHGGPQGAWTDDFHYRWNLQMFASRGYVVVATNPRGSYGYGQKFTDEISKDWGGKVYIDLMNSVDYALKNFGFIDSKNIFAAGASYGGYMINWIAGHTNRFNALVSHDGVFNLESMWGTTEELWFPEWEIGGTPWENRKLYEKWSPHRYIQNCKTPMLVVHGALDFRVCEEQAMQLFTSLQRLGVESKFLYFPDEFHFVTKPQNSRLWWNTILDWFESHKK
jgi:dipeptidyl aminopeptidase/acylaminoacyl peptidase